VAFLGAGSLDQLGLASVSLLPPLGLPLSELPWLAAVPVGGLYHRLGDSAGFGHRSAATNSIERAKLGMGGQGGVMARVHSDRRARRPRRRFRSLAAVALILLVAFGIGFGRFLANLPPTASDSAAQADAIVALTGEGGRLAPAVTLLEKGSGKRLLITGVNRQISKPI